MAQEEQKVKLDPVDSSQPLNHEAEPLPTQATEEVTLDLAEIKAIPETFKKIDERMNKMMDQMEVMAQKIENIKVTPRIRVIDKTPEVPLTAEESLNDRTDRFFGLGKYRIN